jgi:hypothetical protein
VITLVYVSVLSLYIEMSKLKKSEIEVRRMELGIKDDEEEEKKE